MNGSTHSIELVARELLGEPNAQLSSATELRFGNKGSICIDLVKGRWFDHEANEGGGPMALIHLKTGRKDGRTWMREKGIPQGARMNGNRGGQVVYDYKDESGSLVHQVVRTAEKGFFQRKPDGSLGVKGVPRLPYRLPELASADSSKIVFVVEGEKDVDRLRSCGLIATCNAGGAGKWHVDHAKFLAGRDVVVLADHDAPGRAHGEEVAESLQGIARSIRHLDLPDPPLKGDVSDWLDAGGTAPELLKLVDSLARAHEAPSKQDEGCTQEPAAVRNTLTTVDLGGLMQSELSPPEFVIEGIVPRGGVTLFGGHGGTGKSQLALCLAAHVAAGRPWGPFALDQGRALFISLEDGPGVILFRLRKIIETYDLDPKQVAAGLQILDGSAIDAALVAEISNHGIRTLVATPLLAEVEAAAVGADLVVIDNASDSYDGDENSRRQVRSFLRQLTQLGRANNVAILLLAHIDKAAAKAGSRRNSYSGATAWHNSARSRLALIDDDGPRLVHEKSNFGRLADPVFLSFNKDGVPLPIAGGSQMEANQRRVAEDAAEVLEVVKVALAAGLTIPTASTGPTTAAKTLSSRPELAQCYRDPAGRRRLTAALLELSRSGRLVKETFRTRSRKDGERWALAPASEDCGEQMRAP